MEGYMSDRNRALKGKPALRPPDADVDVQNADAQHSSPLFRLPKEVRLLIYEKVFGTGLIHFDLRKSEPTDNWLPAFSEKTVFEGHPGHPRDRVATTYRRATYRICHYDDWARTYDLSKCKAEFPQDDMHNSPKELRIRQYRDRHTECARISTDYKNAVLQLDLLRVCRRIYDEARALPYEAYTFDMMNPQAGQQFTAHTLTRRQTSAIRTVHAHISVGSGDEFSDLLLLQYSFPGLRSLKISCGPRRFDRSDTAHGAWKDFFRGNMLKHVEVICCYDGPDDSSSDGNKRRNEAVFIEKYLTCRSLLAANECLDHWFEWGDCSGFSSMLDGKIKAEDSTINAPDITTTTITASGTIKTSSDVTSTSNNSSKLSTTSIRQSASASTSSGPEIELSPTAGLLRQAQDLVTGCRSDQIELKRLRAELAAAKNEIAELKGPSQAIDKSTTPRNVTLAALATTSPIGRLPAELLSRVFYFLPRRTDVANCRLVCRGFHEHSSPFLITQVVFETRVETIARLLDVIEHPYFSKHVTTLLYDASYYDEDKANDAESYATAVRESPAAWLLVDGSDMGEAYMDLWNRLRDGVPEQMREVIEFRAPAAYRMLDPEEFLDPSFYRGFSEYVEADRAQRELHESRLPKYVLEHVFAKLPRLRHVRYGDFRNLAHPDENSVFRLCARLWGRVLGPEGIGMSSQWNPWEQFMFFLEMSCRRDAADLESFAVGGHRYCHYSKEKTDVSHGPYCYRPAIPIDLDFTLLLSNETPFEKLANLRSLQLPLALFGDDTTDMEALEFEDHLRHSTFVRPLLESCSSSLMRLELTAEDTGLMPNDTIYSGEEDLEKTARFLHGVLFDTDLTFPRLTQLDLRGWVIGERSLQGFLMKTRNTLRELRLVDNIVLYVSERLAKWGGENLLLDGVQIDNFMHCADSGDPNCDLEAAWLAGRHNSLESTKLMIMPRKDRIEGSAEWRSS